MYRSLLVKAHQETLPNNFLTMYPILMEEDDPQRWKHTILAFSHNIKSPIHRSWHSLRSIFLLFLTSSKMVFGIFNIDNSGDEETVILEEQIAVLTARAEKAEEALARLEETMVEKIAVAEKKAEDALKAKEKAERAIVPTEAVVKNDAATADTSLDLGSECSA